MQRNLVDSDSNWYAGAKRLELLLSGPSHDTFAVDVYYHQSVAERRSRGPLGQI